MYDNPFAEEVRENPYDDTPRLIFADFLDDNGDPLGQLIRVQVALAELDRDDQRRTSLEKQEQTLIDEYGERWLAPLRKFGAQGLSPRCFQRGLVERIRISASDFLSHAEELCLQCPALHTVCITNLDIAFRRFADAQLPKQIRGLDLSPCRLGSAAIEPLNWPMMVCIEQLTELNLRLTKASDTEITQLCSRNLSHLERLDLTACGLTAKSGFAIAACTTLTSLRVLKLGLNSLGDSSLISIARSASLGQLKLIDLASNGITNDGIAAVARSSTLVSLEHMNLRANIISNSKWASVTSFPHLSKLKEIDLRNN